MRFKFLDVFQEHPDGSLTPKKPLKVNQVVFKPGTILQKGVAFGGVDFHLYKYWDLAGEENEGVLTITGFYKE